MSRGLFVVLEGLDGAGTTTLLHRLSAELSAKGHRVVSTAEPTDGPIGVLIRQALTKRLHLPGGEPLAPESLALMFAADRIDHLRARIEPALERGEVVISDRYVLSSIAYQGSSVPTEWVEQINARARQPDVTLFVAVAPETAAQRRARRGGPAELFDDDARQRAIDAKYREAIARRKSVERIIELDGAQPPEAVADQAMRALEPLLTAPRR